PACCNAATLIDCYVDNYAAVLHQLQIFALDQVGGFRAWNEHRADDQVSQLEILANCVAIAEQDIHIGRCHVVEITQPVHVHIENRDVCPEAGGDLGGICSDDTASQ